MDARSVRLVEIAYHIVLRCSAVQLEHRFFRFLVGAVSSMIKVRLRNKPYGYDQDASEDELGSNQWLPLRGLMNSDKLSCDSADKLSKCNEKLVGTNHEATNLEWCNLRDIGDEYRLSKADSQADKYSCSEPTLPVEGADLGDGATEQDHDGTHHSWFSTKAICEVSSSEHAQCLGHLREALPERNHLGTDSWLATDSDISHLVDKGLHRDHIARNLLLKAVIEGSPIEDHAEDHGLPECLDHGPSSERGILGLQDLFLSSGLHLLLIVPDGGHGGLVVCHGRLLVEAAR